MRDVRMMICYSSGGGMMMMGSGMTDSCFPNRISF